MTMQIILATRTHLKIQWPCGIITRVNHIKSSRALERTCYPFSTCVRGTDTMSDHTRVPHFPANLNDYAPWVAIHGLLAPYGECQCGCGQATAISDCANKEYGWKCREPKRFLKGHYRRQPWIERFWEKVDKRGPGDCWEWQASTAHGYGQLNTGGGMSLVHRLSYELHVGAIPDGLLVCHHCDNPLCVNPQHLFVGTNADNVQDMLNKNRNVRGERQGASKLTEGDVREIRQRFADGERQSSLAREYGVCVAQMNRIVHRKEWQHVS